MNLLVVEDDPSIGRVVQRGFAEAGHCCVRVANGIRGLDEASTQRFDVIILDLMLPGLPGLDLLRQLRSSGQQTPVIVLTARGTVEDRVLGLSLGADDYLVKPFAFAELAARVEAVCRRLVKPAQRLETNGLTLDLATHRVTRSGQVVDLSPTEFKILELLMRHAGQVVTRTMLCEHLWDADWEGLTNVIEVNMARIRAKLDRSESPSLINTVRGRGYAIRTA